MKSLMDFPRRKEMALGFYIGDCDVAVAEMAAYAGFDYMRIDNEHSMSDPSKLAGLIRVCADHDIPSLVRVSSMEEITKFLDCGATGIMVPDIESREQAIEAVNRCKYAPMGARGMASAARALRYGYQPFEEYFAKANDTIALCVQIESQRGVEDIEEIVSVDGVDFVTVGRWDLAQSMGIPGQTSHPEVEAAEERVMKKALEYGKYPLLSAGSPEKLLELKERQVYCATICFDVQFITGAFQKQLERFREVN